MPHVSRLSAAIHTREADPTKLGDPEHFRRFCRSHPEMQVQVFVAVEGFTVPPDGVWFVNGLWNPKGTERSLLAGDKVTYRPTVQNPEDDRPQDTGFSLGRVRAQRVDPKTARLLRFVRAEDLPRG